MKLFQFLWHSRYVFGYSAVFSLNHGFNTFPFPWRGFSNSRPSQSSQKVTLYCHLLAAEFTTVLLKLFKPMRSVISDKSIDFAHTHSQIMKLSQRALLVKLGFWHLMGCSSVLSSRLRSSPTHTVKSLTSINKNYTGTYMASPRVPPFFAW